MDEDKILNIDLKKKVEMFTLSQIESIFSAILHYTDFPILNKSIEMGKSFSKDEWLEIFSKELQKDVKWPQ